MKIMNKKIGYINIFMTLGIIVIIIIFSAVFLVYYQVDTIITIIRQDLFYISNNAILAFDAEDLAYRKYTLDVDYAKQIIENLLNKNYENSSVKKIIIDDIKFQNINELLVKVNVRFKSFITIFGKNEYEFTMNEKVKISLLEYK